jgi:hypothetical protein
VDSESLPVVKKAKILRLVMSSTLQWNDNIRKSIKKANKCFYFIVLLKRAGVEVEDVLKFDCTVIRPVHEYCAQAFHHSLPKYLAEELEVVQKRVLKIISPEMVYCDALEHFRLPTLFQRREDMCNKPSLPKSLTTRRIDFTICCLRRVRLHGYNIFNEK